MNENTISGDVIGVTLRQLGASSVREIHSMMHIATFDLGDGTEVSYVFNITKGNKYYLQRMRPYALPWGLFADSAQIVRFITEDLKRFRNAAGSSNFKKFVGIADKASTLTGQLEELFLSHNVDAQALAQLEADLELFMEKAAQMRDKSAPL